MTRLDDTLRTNPDGVRHGQQWVRSSEPSDDMETLYSLRGSTERKIVEWRYEQDKGRRPLLCRADGTLIEWTEINPNHHDASDQLLEVHLLPGRYFLLDVYKGLHQAFELIVKLDGVITRIEVNPDTLEAPVRQALNAALTAL